MTYLYNSNTSANPKNDTKVVLQPLLYTIHASLWRKHGHKEKKHESKYLRTENPKHIFTCRNYPSYMLYHASWKLLQKREGSLWSCPPLPQIPQVLQAIRTWKKCTKFSGEQRQGSFSGSFTGPRLTCSWTGQSAYVAVPLTGCSRLQKPPPSTKSSDLLEQEHGYSALLLLLRILLSSHSLAPVQPQQPI